MRLLEGYSTLYTSLSVRVSRIGAKLVCLSVTSKQAKVAPECCHAVQGWKWRCPLTFNVDGFSNKAGQISEVMDVVLQYKTHSKRMLLAVSGLGKQNMILGYNWLKDHNPKINWEKGEVKMTRCPLRCKGGCALRKEQTHQKRTELRALRLC